jgi:diacylglycerol kinase (ATP)
MRPARHLDEPLGAARRGAGLLSSFGHAFRGLVGAAASERNMKIHVVAGMAVGVAGGELALSTAARLVLLLCVMLVLSAETLNAALESLVDLHTREFRREARRVKDAAAGAVLVLALGSVLATAMVVAGNWDQVVASLPRLRAGAGLGGALLLLTAGLLAPARRPAVLDALGAAAGAILLALLALRSLSLPFTAMATGLFALAAASAWHARADRET